MNGERRQYLQEGQEIRLYASEQLIEAKTFQIIQLTGEGGSAVCYDAVRLSDGQSGKLKEFYPCALEDGQGAPLVRLSDGTLICAEESSAAGFRCACNEFGQKYIQINETIRENEGLKNYIQTGEILFSGSREDDEPRLGSVYVWTPGLSGRSFDQYLEEIHRQPEVFSNRKLQSILRILSSLSDAVQALHNAGILHMDIKPSNFMVINNSDGEVNTGVVSMFDIGTFYNAKYNDSVPAVGTPGYCAPEVLRGEAGFSSDIFSIGATLFYAISRQNFEDYRDIERVIRESQLVRGLRLEHEKHEELIKKLIQILQTCLNAEPQLRYAACRNLCGALNAAAEMAEADVKSRSAAKELMRSLLYTHPLYEAIPPAQREIRVLVLGSDEYAKMFIDVCLEAGQMRGYSLRIDAFSEKPNDDCENYLKDRRALKRFVCVGIAQNSEDDRSQADGNAFKPVDGTIGLNDSRSYGTLRFLAYPTTCDESGNVIQSFRDDTGKKNEFLAETILYGACESAVQENAQYLYDYIFISLGGDSLNRSIAENLSGNNFVGQWQRGAQPPVCYVSENVGSEVQMENGLYEIQVNRPFSPGDVNPELEQMAFNAHLLWQSANIDDMLQERRAFRENAYEYNSSMACALSAKYKLRSIGIAFDSDLKLGDREGFTVVQDVAEAAKAFSEQVLLPRSKRNGKAPQEDERAAKLAEEAEEKFNALVALEHRRWVVSLVTEGWEAPGNTDGGKGIYDFRKCSKACAVRNKKDKTHPCLVFSTEAAPLKTEAYRKNNRSKWNQSIDQDLDELDHMSVALHQFWRSKAKELSKTGGPLQSAPMSGLEKLVRALKESEDSETMRAFFEFRFCIRNILNGVESYSRHYDRYADALDGMLKGAYAEKPEEYDVAKNYLAQIARLIFPAREENLYRDYKANDEILIERLPYILTYRCQPCVALAFEDGLFESGRNEAVFANVASVTVLKPERIVYLYNCDRDTNLKLFVQKVSAVLNYLGRRHVNTKVSFAIACTNISEEKKNSLQQELRTLNGDAGKDRSVAFDAVKDCAYIKCDSEEEAAEKLAQYLNQSRIDLYDCSTRLFHSAWDNVRFVECIEARIPRFVFDWRRKEFNHLSGCEYLSYVHDTASFIRVSDMFALMNARDTKFNVPMFTEDYQKLWKIYTENGTSFEYSVGNWNRMCRTLSAYEASYQSEDGSENIENGNGSGRELAVFKLPEYNGGKTEEIRCSFGNTDQRTLYYICSRLKDFGILSRYEIIMNTEGEIALNCDAQGTYSKALEALAKNLRSAGNSLQCNVVKRATRTGLEVVVCQETLTVENVNLDLDGGAYSLKILKELEKNGFITLEEKPGGTQVNITYTSPRIKKLLTTAGEILEIYTYYEVLKTGYFDDVVCSYEFAWEEGEVKNELDLVLTKGFRSIIVECKAVAQLKLDYYHKLDSISEKFGIGTLKVLVGNNYSQNKGYAAINEMQQSRGNQLNIITLNGKDVLKDIGNALRKLMEDSSGLE